MSEKPRYRVNKNGVVADGFSNMVAGIGLSNPKAAAAHYLPRTDVGQADAAFRTSTWYGKILTIPADDAVKNWRKWQMEKSQIELIEAEEKRLSVRSVVHKALLVSRHEGGALILVGGLPGANESPLDMEQIKKGDLTFLHVLSRHEVTHDAVDRDPLSPTYGYPREWTLTNSGSGRSVVVHGSRVIPIRGRHVPGGELRTMEFWGDSVWLHLADAVIAADSGHAVISALMHEAKIDVVTIPNMAEMMSTTDGEQSMMRRWEVAARLKSLMSIMLIDGGPTTENAKEEQWSQKQMRWDGLSDVMRMILTILSGAADIPYTRLTGDQQKGLANNDEGSMRNYYSAVNTEQVLRIGPMLTPLDKMLLRSATGGDGGGSWYTWNPLFQLSDKERAEVDKLEADTAKVYADTMLIPSPALEATVQNRMVESGRWPGLETELEKVPKDYVDPRMGALLNPTQPFSGGGSGPRSEDSSASDAAPKNLYVSRSVLNGEEIVAWAKSQGFATTVPASEMHVTIAFSRSTLDWMKVSQAWASKIELPAGGPRMMDQFGEAVVLLIRASELEWRHREIVEAGASWDHGSYQPHITITYSGEMPEGVQPYTGEIVLGPEVFRELSEDWAEGLEES